MGSNWVECPRDGVMPQYSARYSVTMNPMGDIAMSRRTWENMGSPGGFVMLFDKVNSRIGLKPSKHGMRNFYPAISVGVSGGRVVRGHRLTKEFGIKLPMTIQFQDLDTDDDGILILDLRTATISNRARNHYRNRS